MLKNNLISRLLRLIKQSTGFELRSIRPGSTALTTITLALLAFLAWCGDNDPFKMRLPLAINYFLLPQTAFLYFNTNDVAGFFIYKCSYAAA